MRKPHDGELAAAPELAVVAITEHALEVLDDALRVEHPTLDDDFAPGDPPSLCAAREITDCAEELRGRLRRYRTAVRAALSAPEDDLPF